MGTVSDAGLSSTPTVFDLPLASPQVLAANTRYWIVLSSAAASQTSAYWAWSNDQTAIGVAGEYFGDATIAYPNTSGPCQMRLSDTAAPEPSISLLVLLGGGILVARRRVAR